jgi:hypothetical protein
MSTVEGTIRQVLAYQLYSRSRATAMRWLIGLVAGLSGYLGTTLLMKQNKLIEAQNTYLVETNKPSLGIKTNGATYRLKGIKNFEYEGLVHIENFGKRDAQKVSIHSKIYEMSGDSYKIINTETISTINPIFQDQVLDYIKHFNSDDKSKKHFWTIKLVYTDGLTKKNDTSELYYRFPTIGQIDSNPRKEHGLFNIDVVEFEAIQKYDSTHSQ